jgi:tetratricopeptide (TPR) repeat protein
MAAQRRPDDRLRTLLTEAGWTHQRLAQEVNAIGADSGLTLRYDRTSVAHWLSGSTPHRPVPAIIAEAFSRRLGREVRDHAHDETSPDNDAPCSRPDDAGPGLSDLEVDPVTRLVELNAGRRALLHGAVYSIASLSIPHWAQARISSAGRGLEGGRIGRDEAAGAEAMGRVFSDTDAAFGGGRSVTALAAYLAYDIAPKLRSRAAPTVRQAMFGAATELTYLCAFMYFDRNQHAAAQRYYTVALRLAAENHDPAGYATILRAMSVQAHSLGHHHRAANLADTALSTAPDTIPPGTRAFLHGQAAVAAAGDGDRRTALTHLGKAETFLDRGSATDTTIGAYHEASLAHQHPAVLAAFRDIPGAAGALAASIRHRPATERRSRAITLAALAQLYLRQGHLDQATATWQLFLHDYPHLTSGRATTALAILKKTLRPHQHNTAVAQVWARAAQL